MNFASLRTAVVLGLLTAIGPSAIDMYVPALPIIGEELGAGAVAVQTSLLAFFLAVALGQLVAGPLSDVAGRKPVLYAGLVVFATASAGSALASEIEWLIAFRALQGLGAAAMMVVPRAIVRDLHTGAAAARLMSILMVVFSISPILAPPSGSLLIESFGWRSVFWLLAVVAAIGVCLLALAIKETSPTGRSRKSLAGALARYRQLVRDREFLGIAFIDALGITGFFIYLANASFVLIDYYGLPPTLYSLFFSINAVAFFAMSQLTGWLTARFGLKRVVLLSVTAYATVMSAMLVVMAAGAAAALRDVGLPLCRIRRPRPRHPVDLGAGHGGAWRECRQRFGAVGYVPCRGRHSLDTFGRIVFRRHTAADGGRDRHERDRRVSADAAHTRAR